MTDHKPTAHHSGVVSILVLPDRPTEATVTEYLNSFDFDQMKAEDQDDRFNHALDFVTDNVFWWAKDAASQGEWLDELCRDWAIELMRSTGIPFDEDQMGAVPAGPLPSRLRARLELGVEICNTLFAMSGQGRG